MTLAISNRRTTRHNRARIARGRPTQPTDLKLETGLSLWSGTSNEEYLIALRPWSTAFKVYHEMVDDAIIGGMLEAVKTPMLASKFQMVAGSDSDEDRQLANNIRDDLFNLNDVEWVQHVEEMTEMLDYGFAIAEKQLEKRKDGLLHISALVAIGQETLHKWGPRDKLGGVGSFQQQTPQGGTVAAPMSKLLHFQYRGRKRNPEGKSLLRTLYRSWYFKKNLEALEAIGVERDVGNTPVARLAEGVRYTPAQITHLEASLRGFRVDEALFVILPPGVELDAYGGGNKVYDVRMIIRDYQHLIRQRFFADFLALGSEQVGTQALAREMTTFFGLAIRSVQERMLAVWNRQLIPWYLQWNNIVPVSGVLPKLDWLRPGDQNIQSLAQAYQMLISSGLVTPDEDLENRVRIQAGLPELAPGKRDELRAKNPTPPNSPNNPSTITAPSNGVTTEEDMPSSRIFVLN